MATCRLDCVVAKRGYVFSPETLEFGTLGEGNVTTLQTLLDAVPAPGKVCAMMYITDNLAATTYPGDSSFVDAATLAASWNPDLLYDMEVSELTGAVTYTGTATIIAKVDLVSQVSMAGSVARTMRVGVAKNGVVIANDTVDYTGVAPDPQGRVSALVQLATNDVLTVQIANMGAAEDMILNQATLVVHRLYKP